MPSPRPPPGPRGTLPGCREEGRGLLEQAGCRRCPGSGGQGLSPRWGQRRARASGGWWWWVSMGNWDNWDEAGGGGRVPVPNRASSRAVFIFEIAEWSGYKANMNEAKRNWSSDMGGSLSFDQIPLGRKTWASRFISPDPLRGARGRGGQCWANPTELLAAVRHHAGANPDPPKAPC